MPLWAAYSLSDLYLPDIGSSSGFVTSNDFLSVAFRSEAVNLL